MRKHVDADGNVTWIPPTQEELDAIPVNQAIADAMRTQQEDDAKDVTKVPKMLKAIALWVGDLHGLTPANVKAQIKAKYESLP